MAQRLALVLGGGGVTGIAWETGFLLGVQDETPAAARRLVHADLLLGTSAGSAVAAQISSGAPLPQLYARQVSEVTHEISPHVEIDDLMELFENAGARRTSVAESLREIGQQALAAQTVAEEVRRSVIAHRLPSHDWPDRRLEVTAIDVETGELVRFNRHSGVSLVDAVAASCAVPLIWPPVTIGGRRYMDGGVANSANVDAVDDVDAVVMLSPTAEPGLALFGRSVADELAAFPGCAIGFFADDGSIAAFGRNLLDPACRGPAAVAGRDQGRRQASEIADFLAGH